MPEKSYGERTLDHIAKHCALRGIPEPEIESVHAFIADKYGVPVREMNEPQLKKLSREMGDMFYAYLEGNKRRGGAATVW